MTLRELDDVLSCDAHYQATPTRNHGPHDPVADAPKFVSACPCGAGPARLVTDFPDAEQRARGRGGGPNALPKRRHFVACKRCGRRGQSAVIEWNRERVDASLPIDRIPFFNLAGLSTGQAQDRVKSIKPDLALRKAQAKQPSAAGIETGRRCRERLEAYLGWVIAAGSPLKAHGAG